MEVERIHKEVEAKTTKGQTDSWELAKLVCFYYELCDVRDAIKSLIIDALTIYQGDNSWELKIKLINKCNVTSGGRPQNLLLGPGPKTKSQGTGLLIKVAIARYAGIKASLDIRRVVPLFYLTETLGFAAFTKRSD
jgi:hypothetical protein